MRRGQKITNATLFTDYTVACALCAGCALATSAHTDFRFLSRQPRAVSCIMDDPIAPSGCGSSASAELKEDLASSSACGGGACTKMTGMYTKLVERASPVYQAARKTEEAQALFSAGGEVWAALAACIFAIWALLEPTLASLVHDAAAATRARRCAATGAESFVWKAADNIYDVVDAAVYVVYCKVDKSGGVPARVAHGARDVIFWLTLAGSSNPALHNSGSSEARIPIQEAARAQLVEAASTPYSSLCAAAKSSEGTRLKTALYSVFLAVLGCFMAAGEAAVPVAESYVARGAAAVGARSSTAAGAEAFVLALFYRLCAGVERGVSSLETFAKQYNGPGSLAILQIASALAIFVSWIKGAAVEQSSVTSSAATNEFSTSSTTASATASQNERDRWPKVEEPKDEDDDDDVNVVAKAEVISTDAMMAHMGGPAQAPRAKLQ